MTLLLDIVRVIASCSSLFMLLSPTPMVYKIHKDQDTGVMSIVPLLSVLVNSNMWMMYGYLDKNYVPVFATFLAGEIIALVFILIYYRWAKDRASVHRDMAIAGFVLLCTSLYVILAGLGYTGQTRHEAAQTAGIISDVTATIMYASPLVKIHQVIKHKSAVFIPIHMVCMATSNTTIWTTYSILAKKWIILIPSLGALCLSVFQVILYFFIYNPKTHPLPADYFDAKTSPRGDDNALEAHLSITIESPLVDNRSDRDFNAMKSTRATKEYQDKQFK